MTPEELTNARETRQWIERLILLFFAAIPGWYTMYVSHQNGNRQIVGDHDRERIEAKIDVTKETAEVVATAAKTAAAKAEETAERVATEAAELKTAVAEIKSTIPVPSPNPDP
jgi:hypothetical protein